MSTKRDYYEILGIARNATIDEVKKAYRTLAIKFHPDKNPGDKTAEAKFREATEAYEIISDVAKRSQYDQFGHAGTQNSGGNYQNMDDIFENFGDIFGSFFGNGQEKKSRKGGPAAQRGQDLSQKIEISLKEAYLGCAKEIKIYHFEICTLCKGNGCKDSAKPTTCKTCKGSGSVVYRQGFFTLNQTCSSCHGQGFAITNPCTECRGQTRIQKHEKLSVNIPAGIFNEADLRIPNKGDAGIFGGSHGDLYLSVAVLPDKIFSRRDNDLLISLTLPYPQLVLGSQIEIENIDGTKETITVPKGCPVGKEIILAGKGFVNLRSHGKGNLVIIPLCDIPTKLSTESKNSLLAYAGTLENNQSKGISGFFKKFLG